MKFKVKAIKKGEVDFSDMANYEANVMYLEEVDDPRFMKVRIIGKTGTSYKYFTDVNRIIEKDNDEAIGNSRTLNDNMVIGGGTGVATPVLNQRDAAGNWLDGTTDLPTGFPGMFHWSGTTWHKVDSFENNNGSYGGSKAMLKPTTIELLDAMGRTTAARRWGYSFMIGQVVQNSNATYSNLHGDGTLFRAGLGYRSFGRHINGAMWVRMISGTGSTYGSSINGGGSLSRHKIFPADGWVHVASRIETANGYSWSCLLYMTKTAQAQIAIPYGSFGFIHKPLPPEMHTAPIF